MSASIGGDLSLPANSRKELFSIALFGALTAEAGRDLKATSPGADYNAVDCTVTYPGMDVRVQMKCTARDFSKQRNELSWTVEDQWRAAWERCQVPLYFVVVKLWEDPVAGWVCGGADLMSHIPGCFSQHGGVLVRA